MTTSRVSLIIPVQNDQDRLPTLLQDVLAQEAKPFELLIVDSSEQSLELDGATRNAFGDANIALRYIHSEPLNPGAARNLGIQRSTGEWIAFLDAKTLPPGNWLQGAWGEVERAKSMGVFGKTLYAADSRLEKWIRAATYGVNPVVTIPGSLFKREVFSIVGSFIPTIVAGEDTDWMLRARLHGVDLSRSSPVSLKYIGLIGMKFPSLLRKWWRNYRACRDIPYLSDHKAIYLFFFNLFVIFIAMHWNAAVAHWDESSTVYISHITKLTIGLIAACYIGYRGFYLPLRRGASLGYLMPLEWVFVFGVGFSIDVVKLLAFLPSFEAITRRVRYAFFRE